MEWQYILSQLIEKWEMLDKNPMTISIIKIVIVVMVMLLIAGFVHSGLHYVFKIKYNRTKSDVIFNTAIIISVISGIWLGYTLFASGQISKSHAFRQPLNPIESNNINTNPQRLAGPESKEMKHSFKTQKEWVPGRSPEECQKIHGDDKSAVAKCQGHWNTTLRQK